MENDTKNVLMQYLYRFAEHYDISTSELVSFKKRNDLLEKLGAKNKDALVVISALSPKVLFIFFG